MRCFVARRSLHGIASSSTSVSACHNAISALRVAPVRIPRYFHAGTATTTMNNNNCRDRYRDLPEGMKSGFTVNEYAIMVDKLPRWHTVLSDLDCNTINSKLVAAGLPPQRTPEMAVSIMTYLAAVDIPPFRKAGSWPTAHPPITRRGDGLTFLETAAGPWCFEPRIRQRMVRHREYLLLWERFQEVYNGERSKGSRGLLVTGHPGIGKTLLLDVLLSWILYTYPTTPVVVISVDGVTLFTNHGSPKRYTAEVTSSVSMLPKVIMRLAYGREDMDKKARLIVLHDIKSTNSFPYQAGLLSHLKKKFHLTCVPVPDEDRQRITTFDFVSAGARRTWLEQQDSDSIAMHQRRLRELRANDPARDVLERALLARDTGCNGE